MIIQHKKLSSKRKSSASTKEQNKRIRSMQELSKSIFEKELKELDTGNHFRGQNARPMNLERNIDAFANRLSDSKQYCNAKQSKEILNYLFKTKQSYLCDKNIETIFKLLKYCKLDSSSLVEHQAVIKRKLNTYNDTINFGRLVKHFNEWDINKETKEIFIDIFIDIIKRNNLLSNWDAKTIINVSDFLHQSDIHPDINKACIENIIIRKLPIDEHDLQLLIRSQSNDQIIDPKIIGFILNKVRDSVNIESQTVTNLLSIVNKIADKKTQADLLQTISTKPINLYKRSEFDCRQSYFLLEEVDIAQLPAEIRYNIIHNIVIGLNNINGELLSLVINEAVNKCRKAPFNEFISQLSTTIIRNDINIIDKGVFDLCITLNCIKKDEPYLIRKLLTDVHVLKAGDRSNPYNGDEINRLLKFIQKHFRDHSTLKTDEGIQKLLRHVFRSLDFSRLGSRQSAETLFSCSDIGFDIKSKSVHKRIILLIDYLSRNHLETKDASLVVHALFNFNLFQIKKITLSPLFEKNFKKVCESSNQEIKEGIHTIANILMMKGFISSDYIHRNFELHQHPQVVSSKEVEIFTQLKRLEKSVPMEVKCYDQDKTHNKFKILQDLNKKDPGKKSIHVIPQCELYPGSEIIADFLILAPNKKTGLFQAHRLEIDGKHHYVIDPFTNSQTLRPWDLRIEDFLGKKLKTHRIKNENVHKFLATVNSIASLKYFLET